MKKPVKVLIVEDSEDDAKLALRALRNGGFNPTHRRVQTAADLKTALAGERWDAVISDFQMPGFTGMDALRIFRSTALDIPFILVSGTIGEEVAVEAMKAGANDYLMKANLARLAPALERELKETQMRAAHRHTQDSLTDSEERFRQMAENIRDMFFLVDADSNRMLYVSPAYEEIWGRSRESLYADPESRIEAIHQDERASIDGRFKQGMASGTYEFEYRIVRPDGSIRWIETRGFPVRDDAGKIVRIAGVAKDITERKHSEQALRESERRFSDLLKNVELVSVMRDREERITYCNEYLLRLTGWQYDEVIGQNWIEHFVPPEIAEEKRKIFAALLLNMPDAWHHESEILTRSGDRRLIRWNNSVLRSGAGDVIGTASIGEDITEQTRAEISIRRLNRIYAVLSNINSVIVRVRDRDELFNMACRIAVDKGGFRMAMIAIVERNAMKIVPVASAGVDEKLLTAINVHLSSSGGAPEAETTFARVIRQKKPVASNVSPDNPTVMFGKKLSGSTAVLPLIVSDDAVGVFALYANETGFFDDEEMKLLTELAGDIAFAMANISRQEELAKLARIRAVSGAINAAIIRIHDRDELFGEACRIAVEHGQFKMAWIGVADWSAKKIVPIASAGAEPEFLTLVRDRFSLREDAPDGNTMSARAVRSRKAIVSNDIREGPRLFYTKERLERGIASIAILPLLVADDAVGVLALYADEIGFFDEEEMKLLTELTGDISFALENLGRQQKLANLARIRAVSSEINSAIIRIHDRDELFRETCRIAVGAGGFRMVWVAVVDRSVMQLKPVAWEGPAQDYLKRMPLSVNEADTEKFGLAGRAVCQKKPMVVEDMQHDPRVLLRPDAGEWGVQSLVVLPLLVSDTVVGVLALYADQIGFFNDSEMKLLIELTDNISFALDHIDRAEKLNYLAYYDVLTGLANRSLFLERVAQYMRSAVSGGHKLAVFLIDLERFKNINDSLGRPAGDALLRQVAEWLKQESGDANLVARLGADHFATVLPQAEHGGDGAQLLEEKIKAFMDHPFRLNDAVFRIAVRVGVALFPDDGADADTLFRHAEAALKRAKASGERYLFYTQTMTEAVAGKLTLENQLRQALDNEEFLLHYQPKVNLVSGRITGAEALIRWNDPRTGLVPPGRFIPILEEIGLINEVGRWALRKAIEDYLRWRAAGLPVVRIAVNVSPLQLRHRGFIAEIAHVIGIDSQAAAGLELEITESLIMEDVKHNIASLRAIRAMGITISIDDFGTGFSSLAYLAKLPVDTLKIDRSFVIDMTAAPEGLALVSTIIDLAHSLKLKVVAEGVETEEQSRLLRLLACDEMQGFLFSKPVPAEIFETKFLVSPSAGRGMAAAYPASQSSS